MKLLTPEISWHSREMIYSVAAQPDTGDGVRRIATASADKSVRVWSMSDGSPVFLCELTVHSAGVNVVRFSPDGLLLASGADDNTVVTWRLLSDPGTGENVETWQVAKVLRGHLEGVFDIAWQPSGEQLVSVSVDNTAIVWNVTTGRKVNILSDAKMFVQGVLWDPTDSYVVTISSDKTCRVYTPRSGFNCVARISRLPNQISPAFADDMVVRSFFRRGTASPDGRLILLPGGRVGIKNVTFVFAAGSFQKPLYYLPSEKPSLVVRFCPVAFVSRSSAAFTETETPHRLVFCIATADSLQFYDTQQRTPIAFVSQLHYSQQTDLAWSEDGRQMIVSSSDGYCSFISFEDGELGEVTPLCMAEPAEIQVPSKKKPKTEKTPRPEKPPKAEKPPKVPKEKKTPVPVDNKQRKLSEFLPAKRRVQLTAVSTEVTKTAQGIKTVDAVDATPVANSSSTSEAEVKAAKAGAEAPVVISSSGSEATSSQSGDASPKRKLPWNVKTNDLLMFAHQAGQVVRDTKELKSVSEDAIVVSPATKEICSARQPLLVGGSGSGQSLLAAIAAPGQSLLAANAAPGQSLPVSDVNSAPVKAQTTEKQPDMKPVEHMTPKSFDKRAAGNTVAKKSTPVLKKSAKKPENKDKAEMAAVDSPGAKRRVPLQTIQSFFTAAPKPNTATAAKEPHEALKRTLVDEVPRTPPSKAKLLEIVGTPTSDSNVSCKTPNSTSKRRQAFETISTTPGNLEAGSNLSTGYGFDKAEEGPIVTTFPSVSGNATSTGHESDSCCIVEN